ncbi:MAG: L-seryl-tRNA(Sec) selenium transferase, partial [Pseudoflavonifractor sp.]
GKREFIEKMKGDPLARVTRIDKLSLAALEATLRLCRDPAEAIAAIPTLSMLNAPLSALEERAAAFAAGLRTVCGTACTAEVVPVSGEVGGGSMPTVPLPSYAVALTPENGQTDALEQVLRRWRVPIVGRISHDKLLLDVRTLTEDDMAEIISAMESEDGPCHT